MPNPRKRRVPQVLEFQPDDSDSGAAVKQVTATPESLGLSPRDISLFAATTGPGKVLQDSSTYESSNEGP